MTLLHAYDMGHDYARNGANAVNCHYSLFDSKIFVREWERGKRAGQLGSREATTSVDVEHFAMYNK